MAVRASRRIADLSIDDQERHFVDLVYGTLADQGLWTIFIADVAACHPNGHATLFRFDDVKGSGPLTITAGFDAHWVTQYDRYYGARNPWVSRANLRPLGVGAAAEAALPRSELVATEFYADFLRPQEIETGVGVTVMRDEGCVVALSVVGADGGEARQRSVVSLFDRLAPHLRRVFTLCRNDFSDPMYAAQPLIDGLEAAVFVIGPGRRLIKANRSAETLLENGRYVRLTGDRRVVITGGGPGEALDPVLAAPDAGATASAWICRDRDGVPARISLLSGGRTPMESLLGGPRLFLVIEPLDAGDRVSPDVLRSLYGLTHAEARLMAALAEGFSLTQAASRFEISRETARTHFRSICTKMGVGRQAEAVRLACRGARTAIATGPSPSAPSGGPRPRR